MTRFAVTEKHLHALEHLVEDPVRRDAALGVLVTCGVTAATRGTDGFIARGALRLIQGCYAPVAAAQAVQDLVDAGLAGRAEDGSLALDWAGQQSAVQLAADRAAKAAAKRRQRRLRRQRGESLETNVPRDVHRDVETGRITFPEQNRCGAELAQLSTTLKAFSSPSDLGEREHVGATPPRSVATATECTSELITQNVREQARANAPENEKTKAATRGEREKRRPRTPSVLDQQRTRVIALWNELWKAAGRESTFVPGTATQGLLTQVTLAHRDADQQLDEAALKRSITNYLTDPWLAEHGGYAFAGWARSYERYASRTAAELSPPKKFTREHDLDW